MMSQPEAMGRWWTNEVDDLQPLQSTMITRLNILISFTILTAILPNSAHADDALAKPANAVAFKHFKAGNKLYRVREFEKAIEEYKAGVINEDVPVFHYNLGQSYRQLSRYEDAIWHYEHFLVRGKPTGEVEAAVNEFIRKMKEGLQKKAMSQPATLPSRRSQS